MTGRGRDQRGARKFPTALSISKRRARGLEDQFDRELDLPLRDRRPQQDTCIPAITEERIERRSRRIENVGIDVSGGLGWREVGVIKDIKHLHAELYVEVLRDSLDVVVLENGEIQVRNPGADQDVSARIPAQIETRKRRDGWEH